MFIIPFQAFAQDSSYVNPRGLYIQPIFTVEIMASNVPDKNEYDNILYLLPNFNGFKVIGTEIGYFKGAISYALQFKYGKSINHEDLKVDGTLSGEIYYDHYLNFGIMASERIIGTKTKSNFQFRFSYRGEAGLYFYRGQEYIEDKDYSNARVRDRSDKVIGAELGLDIKIGFRPTPSSAILLDIEPLNVQFNTIPGFTIGFIRSGLVFQF